MGGQDKISGCLYFFSTYLKTMRWYLSINEHYHENIVLNIGWYGDIKCNIAFSLLISAKEQWYKLINYTHNIPIVCFVTGIILNQTVNSGSSISQRRSPCSLSLSAITTFCFEGEILLLVVDTMTTNATENIEQV